MKAIVLSRRDFKEYDQIISVYTKEWGKLEVLARGIKKITSKNTAQVEPFSVVDIVVAKGKELDVLTTVQGIEYFSFIRKDFSKSMMAGYVVGVLDRILQVGEKDERLFLLLLEWLEFVGRVKNVLPVLIDGFIVSLFGCFGFCPNLDSCSICGGVDNLNGFSFSSGGVVCSNCVSVKKRNIEMVVEWNDVLRRKYDILALGDWERILKMSFEGGEYERLHEIIYEFLVYIQEKKIEDWVVIEGPPLLKLRQYK